MRALPFLTLTLALVLGPGAAAVSRAEDLPDFEVADRLVPQDALPEREIRWVDPDVTLTDVLYGTLPGFRQLRLDLYRKRGDAGARPLVIFVHGGGWASANPRAGAAFRNFPAVLATLAKRGYVVASIEFRQSSEAPFPAQLEDLRSAIRFLRTNAGHFGIDASRVGLWGMSSGAHLAALGAVNCADGACVQGFVGWFGLYDLVTLARETPKDPALAKLLRCPEDLCSTESLQNASPVHYVDSRDPPVLLLQGDGDSANFRAQATIFANRLRSAGVATDNVVLPGVGHGFVGTDAAATSAASRQALMATFGFFDRVLLAPRAGAAQAP